MEFFLIMLPVRTAADREPLPLDQPDTSDDDLEGFVVPDDLSGL